MRKIRIKICLLAAMLAVATGIQASDFVVDELCYNITDAEAKTVEVAKYDYTVDGEMVRPTKMDVVVPMTVVNPNDNQTYRVTALGDGAFTVYGLKNGWFDYTSIVLPEGLLEIKANAFSGQSKLTSLVIPGTVKSVKTKFAQMSGISELTFPASVKEMVTIESGRIQKLTIEGSPTITAGSRDYITGSVTNNIVYFIDNDTSYKNVEITLTSAVPPTLPEVTRIQYKAYSGRTTVHVPEGCSDAYNAAGWNQAEVLVEGTDHADVDGIRYYHDSHRAIGYDVVSELNGPLNIPQTVQIGGKTYPVEELAVRMFEGEGESLIKNITAITLPEGLKRLEKNSLYSEVVSATEVTIPASVEYVGTYFLRGETLKKITFKGSPVLADNSVGSNYKLIHFMSQTPPAVGKYSFQSAQLMVVAPDIASIPVYRTTLSGHWGVEKGYELSVYGGLKEADNVYYSAMEDGNACAIYFDGTQTSVALSKTIQIDGAARALAKIQRGLFYYKNITEVIVPETVKTIGGNAFYKCSALTSLQLPSEVEEIGDYAFYECSAWAIDVTLPVLKTLGKGAFQKSGIKSLNLTGAPLATIPESAFGECSSLASITLNEGLSKIESYAFTGAVVTELTIPSTVTDIYTVGIWSKIKKLISKATTPPTLRNSRQLNCLLFVPNGCVTAYRQADRWVESTSVIAVGEMQTGGLSFYFGDTDALLYNVDTDVTGSDVVIPATVEQGGNSYTVNEMRAALLKNSAAVKSVTIPASITQIPNDAFRNCTGLTSVTMPATVTSIGAYAFNGCKALPSVVLPASLGSIGEYGFLGCKALTSIELPAALTEIGVSAFNGCSAMACDVNIPDGVTVIPDGAFDQSGITGITLGKNVKTVGRKAFYNCQNILSITLNEGLTEIGEMGFFNCSKIKELELPASLTTMGSNAFWNVGIKVVCHSAAPLTLPKSTTYSYQFKKCTVIVPVGSVAAYVAATDKGWDESNTYLTFAGLADGVEYRANDTEAWVTGVADDTVVADIKDYLSIDGSQMPVTRIDAAFRGKTQLQKVTVPAAVKALPENMFRDCTSLNAVTFASGSQLQTIGKWAFMSTAVAAIEIPEGVTELPDGVFKNCLSLTEITLPSNLVSVGGGCFYNCKALTTVNVCADNLTIADRAFYSCESLETINSANPLQLSSDISKLGMEFEGCKSLKAVSVAGGMIGSFAFDGCESLVSVGIAEGVKTIGEYAFDGCTSLKRILLPASLQEIKHETFRNVVFEEITCLAVTPPSIRDNTFTDYSAHLCVPAESMAAYAAATGWKEFSNIGDLTTSGVSAVANDGLSVAVCDGRICVDGVGETEMIKVYSTGGMLVGMGLNRQVEVPSPGVYIVEFKKGTVKVAIR